MSIAKVLEQASGSDPFRPKEFWNQIADEHIPKPAQAEQGERFLIEFKDFEMDDPEHVLTLSVCREEKYRPRAPWSFSIHDESNGESVRAADMKRVRQIIRMFEITQNEPMQVWRALLAIQNGVDLKTYVEVYEDL